MKIYFILHLLIGAFLLPISNNNVSAFPSRIRKRQNQTTIPPAPADGVITGDANGGTWQIIPTRTGVNAMHMFVSGVGRFVFVDKFESNPLLQPTGSSALSASFNIDTNTLTPLNIVSDTFCSAGSWLGNGTLVHMGGDVGGGNILPGSQSLRFYDPTVDNWVERVGLMPSKRWYPTMLPLVNGRVLIIGGSTGGTGLNTATLNNPTYTVWPPLSGNDTPDPDTSFPFLTQSLPYNLYVFCHIVPNDRNANLIFILANTQPILYDLDAASVLVTYPKIDIQRTYPQTGTSLMLPLYPDSNYKAEIMICGGQAAYDITATAAASCGRMDLTTNTSTWEMDDFGGIPRVMPDSAILSNGLILFLNGAQTGYAGFRSGPKTNPIWKNSNPAYNPVLYDPFARTYTKMNPSAVPRMYHSTATLTPDGYVFVAGSNPQASVQTNLLFPTEYRAEIYSPPYILNNVPRPTILSINGDIINQSRIKIGYGQSLTLVISLPSGAQPSFTASLIHLGFVTHSQNMGQRFVGLSITAANFDSTNSNQYILTLATPPNPTIIAPGPHYMFINNNGSPCVRAAEVLLN